MYRFVFTCFFIFLGLCQPIAYAQENPEPAKETAQPSPTKKTNIPENTADSNPQKEESNENSSAVIPTDDTALDHLSLKIANKSNYWSMMQTLISGIGLVLIGFATWFAWGAWRAGKDAAQTGQDTLIEAKTANIQSLRAYISLETKQINARADTSIRPPTPITIKITIGMSNVGQTHATDVRYWTDLRFITPNMRDEAIISTKETTPSGVVFPTAKIPIQSAHEIEFKPSITNETNGILVFQMCVYYIDVFGIERETRHGGILDNFWSWYSVGFGEPIEDRPLQMVSTADLNSAT